MAAGALSRSGTVTVFLIAAVLMCAGVWCARAATAVPSGKGIDYTSTVYAWIAEPDVRVSIDWRVQTSGEVVLRVRAGADEDVISDVADIYVALSCDARFANYSNDRVDLIAQTGLESACDAESPTPDVATDVLRFRTGEDTSAGGVAAHFGPTVGLWSTTQAGEHVANTPQMSLSRPDFPYELGIPGSERIGTASRLRVSMDAGPKEEIAYVHPQGRTDGPVERPEDAEPNSFTVQPLLQLGASEYGGTVFSQLDTGAAGFGARDGISPGFARWVDPDSRAWLQGLLLMAGVLIGTAITILVEIAIDRVRSRR
ncbi:hypothetical protein KZX37_09295 [Microbacterium sp. EYE_5]|uniref:hypothetical protein n=1 Tax=unclassified Microbacterium TaxID=2609290 RepID=UPI002003BA67|nr:MULTISPECIES: hypothetical protein [unclassified Microbacterium]MCK6081291.1 hypothetical protein [Microbacterium sp. EYE_382]MCK6086561.1 hypothetical protein [Microbacterium sp. EYE_384]MCK6123941.1 hypothetical protein [Microbacterium sp. EYE_80]MCK6126850.1 hypothetical protein [Microbacterium sp. EYE_79]MCK6142246.1 hypothetical protein [Microbacterium sp. EYE_39]